MFRSTALLKTNKNVNLRIGKRDRLMFGYLGGHVGMPLTYLQNASDTTPGPAADSRRRCYLCGLIA
jgi:hypothetical protein